MASMVGPDRGHGPVPRRPPRLPSLRRISTRRRSTSCAAALRARRFRRGETIFHAGDPGDALFIIAAGAVKITIPADDGSEPAILTTDRSGRVLRGAVAARRRAALRDGRRPRARSRRTSSAATRSTRWSTTQPVLRRRAAGRPRRRDPPADGAGRGPPFPGPARDGWRGTCCGPSRSAAAGVTRRPPTTCRRASPAVAVYPGRTGGHDRRLAPVGEPAARRSRRRGAPAVRRRRAGDPRRRRGWPRAARR